MLIESAKEKINLLDPGGWFINHHFFGRRYDNMPKNGLKTAKIKKIRSLLL